MALSALGGCVQSGLDWDLRSAAGESGFDTTDAALQVTGDRPGTDARGLLSYPGYQVAVAQRGDTVASVAARVGMGADELARHNAIDPQTPLRQGEVLALPRRVAAGAQVPTGAAAQPMDVTAIATTALDRVGPSASVPVAQVSGAEPARHRVSRGETAYSIARTYSVSARALADWNGLGPDLAVREGQTLLIPTATGPAPVRTAAAAVTPPGLGTPTPVPPSAAQPLPDEKPQTAAQAAKSGPVSPNLGAERTSASAARFAMPVEGRIIRPYVKKKNDGIDIAAAPGTPVKAAADGTVATITTDTTQVNIVVLRHEGGLFTIYAGVDAIKVKKGDAVKRGQTLAVVRAGSPSFLHFEVRKGVESTDPVAYLQ